MKNKHIVRSMSMVLIGFLVLQPALKAQEIASGAYMVWLKDKNNTAYSLDQPGEFLSTRSVQRRAHQGLAIDSRDLPINGAYLDQVRDLGVEIKHVSRWLNAFLMVNASRADYEQVLELSFTDTLACSPDPGTFYPVENGEQRFANAKAGGWDFDYGDAIVQLEMLGMDDIHKIGYTGEGVWVGVLDGGFYNVDSLPSFTSMMEDERMLGTRNFVYEGSVFRSSSTHGMKVLSTMAGIVDGELVGTAPHASYLLCMTENPEGETRVEEVAWIEAAEYLDSLGVDVINTSLGYSLFEDIIYDYSYSDLDGKTPLISRAASLTASRGMIASVSAGNSGNDDWYYITPPADATDILAVGAVDIAENVVYFSSRGPSYDARIKPDVSALGYHTYLQGTDGTISQGNGTSFASPLVAGSLASLWQAYPNLPAKDMIHYVRQSSDRHMDPNMETGFGIPNFLRAYQLITSLPKMYDEGILRLWPNPAGISIRISLPGQVWHSELPLAIYDMQGRQVYRGHTDLGSEIKLPESMGTGLYVVKVSTEKRIYRARLIKQ